MVGMMQNVRTATLAAVLLAMTMAACPAAGSMELPPSMKHGVRGAIATQGPVVPSVWAGPADDFAQARAAMVAENAKRRFSSGMVMTAADVAADVALADLKNATFTQLRTINRFPPAEYILDNDVKALIEGTALFAVVRAMPKGGALHVHATTGTANLKYLVEVMFNDPDVYVLYDPLYDRAASPDKYGPCGFSKNTPAVHGQVGIFRAGQTVCKGFRKVSDLRKEVPRFDDTMKELMRMHGGPTLDATTLWKEFGNLMSRMGGIYDDLRAFRAIYTQTMRTLAADGVTLLELRAPVMPVGEGCRDQCVLDLFVSMRDEVRATYPDFDFKIIMTSSRTRKPDAILAAMKRAVDLAEANPGLIRGFDLVAAEDQWQGVGFPTAPLVPAFLEGLAYAESKNVSLPLYLHDGESYWPSDDYLYDGILLGSRRIGHGLNLFRYPALLDEVKARDVIIEVCPLSNQALGYVRDLRMHPAVGYMAQGIQIVLSPDDGGIYGYDGISYDFWSAIMAWDLSLQDIKQLVYNSLTHSTLEGNDKVRALAALDSAWGKFVARLADRPPSV